MAAAISSMRSLSLLQREAETVSQREVTRVWGGEPWSNRRTAEAWQCYLQGILLRRKNRGEKRRRRRRTRKRWFERVGESLNGQTSLPWKINRSNQLIAYIVHHKVTGEWRFHIIKLTQTRVVSGLVSRSAWEQTMECEQTDYVQYEDWISQKERALWCVLCSDAVHVLWLTWSAIIQQNLTLKLAGASSWKHVMKSLKKKRHKISQSKISTTASSTPGLTSVLVGLYTFV